MPSQVSGNRARAEDGAQPARRWGGSFSVEVPTARLWLSARPLACSPALSQDPRRGKGSVDGSTDFPNPAPKRAGPGTGVMPPLSPQTQSPGREAQCARAVQDQETAGEASLQRNFPSRRHTCWAPRRPGRRRQTLGRPGMPGSCLARGSGAKRSEASGAKAPGWRREEAEGNGRDRWDQTKRTGVPGRQVK